MIRVLSRQKYGRQSICGIYFCSAIQPTKCQQAIKQIGRFSRQLSPSSATYTFSFYVILCVVLLVGILYHFVFRRKSRDAFLRQENTAAETMLRQDVIASDLEMNNLWNCEVCFFKSYAAHKTCMLCGTDQTFKLMDNCGMYEKAKGLKPRPNEHSSTQILQEENVESLVPITNVNMRARFSKTQLEEKINLLSLRQQSARRRHDWTREKDDDGKLVWQRKKHFLDRAMLRQSRERNNSVVSAQSESSRSSDSSRSSINSLTIVSRMIQSPQHRIGRMEFQSAEGAVAKSSTDEYVEEVESLYKLPFQQKHAWFVQHIAAMEIPWEVGHLVLEVDRSSLLHDSCEQLLWATTEQLHQPLRVRFTNEPGVDAGGLVREWFTLMTLEIFNSDAGLFQLNGNGDAWMINPASEEASVDHLMYFQAIGRFIGRAIFEGILIDAHLVLSIYKHILGVPITFSDMLFIDREVYRNLLWLRDSPGADALDLNFAIQVEQSQNQYKLLELKPCGADIAVTDENKEEYIELRFKWIMASGVSQQLAALIQGIAAIIPSHMLSIFDHQELELLICGLPEIDVEDWHAHTTYVGQKNDAVIHWFWKIIREFTNEQRSRLLQFTTGSARPPVQGFKALTMNDGRICLFSIQCVPLQECEYPRAHTCFNRIDLPIYEKETDFRQAMMLLLEMEITGFTIE